MPELLDELLDGFLAMEMEEDPIAATRLGIEGHDDRLGEFSAGDYARRAANQGGWLGRFSALGDQGLTSDQRIDRDLVLASLRGRRLQRDWEVWRRDPATYLDPCLSGVFLLLLNRTHPEPELAELAAARLQEVPGVLAAGRANLEVELVSPVFVERARAACRAGIVYVRHMVPAEVQDPGARRRLAEAGEVAAGALEGFLAYLEELDAAAMGSYAIGDELYGGLLQQRELLGYGATAMRERGRAAYDEISVEMAELARRIDGTTDWQSLVQRLNQDHPPTPEAMRQEYAEWTERARRFLLDTGIVTVPEGEECQVVASPPFQRPVLAVASYRAPPAFRPSLRGTFFVPFPPDGTSPEDVQKRLENNSHHSIPAISVHEAYPGHHWHLITVQQKAAPIRKVLGTSYFTEGWALYAEKLMREHGFFTDPRHELCQLDARIFRAARMVVDTSLHIGDMDFEEAVAFMSTKASLSEPTARAEVGRYCSWPTQAPSYLTGALEIERIRGRYLASGAGDLTRFNDSIAGSGMLPVALAEQAVLGPA